MSTEHTDAARRGFGEMLGDRLPHMPPPAVAAIADALFAAAAQGPWEAWPETVDVDGDTIELPHELYTLVADVRAEIGTLLEADHAGTADVEALRALAAQLGNLPPPADG